MFLTENEVLRNAVDFQWAKLWVIKTALGAALKRKAWLSAPLTECICILFHQGLRGVSLGGLGYTALRTSVRTYRCAVKSFHGIGLGKFSNANCGSRLQAL